MSYRARFALLATTIAVVAMLLVPAGASAATTIVRWADEPRPANCDPFSCSVQDYKVTAYRNYTGWARVDFPLRHACANCLDGGFEVALPVYQWTGTAWRTTSLSTNHRRVWVAPYASGWSWIWTQQTGWLAVQSSFLHVATVYTYR